MSFLSNANTNHRLRSTYCKRIFLTLIFFNTLLGCIYYLNEQTYHERIPASPWKDVNHPQERVSNAIQFIQNTLAREYDSDDLNEFYNHVQNKYSLGFKCTREENSSQTTVPNETSAHTRSTMMESR